MNKRTTKKIRDVYGNWIEFEIEETISNIIKSELHKEEIKSFKDK